MLRCSMVGFARTEMSGADSVSQLRTRIPTRLPEEMATAIEAAPKADTSATMVRQVIDRSHTAEVEPRPTIGRVEPEAQVIDPAPRSLGVGHLAATAFVQRWNRAGDGAVAHLRRYVASDGWVAVTEHAFGAPGACSPPT
jgi:hypothetical protein